LIARGSETSVGTTLVAQRGTNVALLAGVALVARLRGRLRLSPAAADLPAMALVGLGDAGANGLYGLASTRGLTSVVAVLASLYPVVTALLARQLLGERLGRGQAAGVATALAGVVLMAGG
jgi:drug/metabolite transporter (DMT)-like permease